MSVINNAQNYNLVSNQKQKIYYCLGDMGSDMKTFVKKNNWQEIKFIDEKMFLTNIPYQIDYDKLEKNLNLKFPDKNKIDYCYINLESPYLEMIRDKSSTDIEFKKGLQVFINIIKYVKKSRPNIKFGFYAVPFTTYWETKTGFLDRNDNIGDLLKEVDFFFPSLYMFYDDGIIGTLKNTEYIESNIKKSIELGIKYKKQVLPFVLHRYHPSNEKIAWSLLNDKVWNNYIKTSLLCKYKNVKVNGLVWWGADSFYFGHSEGAQFRKEYKGNKEEFINYNDKNLLKKAKQIMDNLKKVP